MRKLSNRCLALLDHTLQKDVCRLSDHDIKRVDIPPNIVEKYLTEDVQYACRYWVHHACKTQSHRDQSESVLRFFTTHYTHWLEAMSILGLLSEVVNNINELIVHIMFQTGDDNLWPLLDDARHFAFRNIQTFALAPLQPYFTGLVFAPSGSIVKKTLSNEIPLWLKLLWDGDESWTACLQTLEGHKGIINALSYSPDGNVLVSHSLDGTVRLWDAETGICQQTIEEDGGTFSPVVFTQSGSILIASWVMHRDTVHIWDISTGIFFQTLMIDCSELAWDSVRKASPSPDGRTLAVVVGECALQTWDTCASTCQYIMEGHTSVIHDLTFSSNGYMATASEDHSIRLYEIGTDCSAHRKFTLNGHSSSVTNVFFSPNNRVIASISIDCTVRLWNTSTGSCQHVLEGHATNLEIRGITDIAFSPDGQMLASSSYDCTVRMWDTNTGSCLHVLEGHDHWVRAVKFSPTVKILAYTSDDGAVHLWNSYKPSSSQVLKAQRRSVKTMAFSPYGHILAPASDDHIIRIWQMYNTTHIEKTVQDHKGVICDIKFSWNGRALASASADCTVCLWDTSTRICKKTLVGHMDTVTTIDFTPGDSILATGLLDTTVRLWDTSTGTCRHVLEGHSSEIRTLQFSPASCLLASGSQFDHFVRLWNIDTGTCQFILDCHAGINTVEFSSYGTVLAVACWHRIEDLGVNGKADSDNYPTIRIWDTSMGGHKLDIEPPESAHALSISPDSHKLVSASWDRSVRISDMRTGACERTIKDALTKYELLTNPLVTFTRDHYPCQASSHALSVTKQWISCGQKDLIRLPTDSRPTAAAVFDRMVVLGHHSGRLICMEFPITTPANLQIY